MKPDFSWQILKKYSNIKFNENPLSGSWHDEAILQTHLKVKYNYTSDDTLLGGLVTHPSQGQEHMQMEQLGLQQPQEMVMSWWGSYPGKCLIRWRADMNKPVKENLVHCTADVQQEQTKQVGRVLILWTCIQKVQSLNLS